MSKRKAKRIPVELPARAAARLARRAALIGVPPQDLIKLWLVERLQREGITA